MTALTSPDQLSDLLGLQFSAQQLAAITAPLQPGVIIAGAGSGKTTVMAARVVWLVGSRQVAPEQVLGLTFTRKAAAELSARVRAALQRAGVVAVDGVDEAGEQLVLTYDAFAARLVSEHGLRIGVESDPVMITGASRYRLAARVVTNAAGPFEHLSGFVPVTLVERLLNRGVLHDETRAITKNRQPGRCCDTGCTTPGQPVMVPLPVSRKECV